jgi:hypothetical protein
MRVQHVRKWRGVRKLSKGIHDDNRTGPSATLETNVNTMRVEKVILEKWKQALIPQLRGSKN